MGSSIVFRNSVFADRSGMAASRFVVSAAACVILLHCVAETCESHESRSVRGGNGALAAVFSDFGRYHFPFKIEIKNRFKSVLFAFWR